MKSEPQSIHLSTLSWKSIPHPIPRSHAQEESSAFRTRDLRAESLRTPPQNLPLDSAHLRVTQVTALREERDAVYDSRRHLCVHATSGERNGRHREGGIPPGLLILFFPGFLAAALASERFFNALLFAGLQVVGVTLDLLDDVFLLHLPLKAAQCILEGLTLLQSYLGQLNHTPKPVPFGLDSYCKVRKASQVRMSKTPRGTDDGEMPTFFVSR